MMEQSHPVMHVITGLGTGGAETMLLKLVRSSGGCKSFPPLVVSLTDLGTLGQSIKDFGVPVYSLGMRRGQVSLLKLLSLARLIKHRNPSIIVGWMYHANIATLFARALARSSARLLWNIRHTPYDLSSEKTLTANLIRLSAFLSHRPCRVLYNSQVSFQRHRMLGFCEQNGIVIPNGFDLEAFNVSVNKRISARGELGITGDTPVVGHIARFHPMKDHKSFINAAQRISQSIPNVQFVLAGKGVTFSNDFLADLIKASGLQDRMTLLGERSDVSRLLGAFDILCLSSAWGEGFPNIIGEAMACGVTCVTTDVGDAGIIVGNTGCTVPKSDPTALADACCYLLQATPRKKKALGKAARQRIVAHYSLDEVANTYESVYAETLGVTRSSSIHGAVY